MRFRNLLVAGAAVALSLILMEAGARLWLPGPRFLEGRVELDPLLGFRGLPGYRGEGTDQRGQFGYELNSRGFRGPEIPNPPTLGASRVAFIGDSAVFGERVRDEQLMTALTAAALGERGEPTEVYNLSGLDYGTGQQLLLLRQLGPALRPEAVVLLLHPVDDLINNAIALAGSAMVSRADHLRPYLIEDNGVIEDNGEFGVRYAHPIRAALRRHSRVYAALEGPVLNFAVARQITWLYPWSPNQGVGQRLASGLTPREDFEIFRNHDPGHRWEQAWRTTLGLLRAFRDECEALEAKLLVVVVPSMYQVERNAKRTRLGIETLLVTRSALDGYVDWNVPERRLARFFAREGIESRLLLSPLRAAAGVDSPTFGLDEQLAPRGHEVAARTIVAWLTAEEGEASNGPQTGRPVRTLADPDSAPRLLDFAAAPQTQYLGNGWLRWEPEGSGDAWGWMMGPSALVVLPAHDAELVLRGQVPAGTTLPVAGRIDVAGRATQDFSLEQIGAFDVRVSWPETAHTATEDGYLVAILSTSGSVVIQQVGFDLVESTEAIEPLP